MEFLKYVYFCAEKLVIKAGNNKFQDLINAPHIYWLFRQVVAYCCMTEMQKAFSALLHSAMNNHLSIVITMPTEWMVAQHRFDCILLFFSCFGENNWTW